MTKCCGHERFGAFCPTCGKALPQHHAPLEDLVKYLRDEQGRLAHYAQYEDPSMPPEARRQMAQHKERQWACFLSWADQIEAVIAERAQPAEQVSDVVRSIFTRKRA